MPRPYTQSQHQETSFNCPFRKSFAKQIWGEGCVSLDTHSLVKGLRLCQCNHCFPRPHMRSIREQTFQ